MNALSLLTSRRSNKKLFAPAPNSSQLELIFQAALQVPDHGKLQPYRFVVIEKEGLNRLESLLEQTVEEFNLGEDRLKKAKHLPHRAPMFIAVIAKINKDIAKVPCWEQIISAGCAAYAIQLASNAQGFDNCWITGPWVEGSALRQAFKCNKDDKIIALIMIGTSEEKSIRQTKQVNKNELISYL